VPATISASIMAANMWKNSMKNIESDNNKTLYETLLDFFLQRNGTYFPNKPHKNSDYVACFNIAVHLLVNFQGCFFFTCVCVCGYRFVKVK